MSDLLCTIAAAIVAFPFSFYLSWRQELWLRKRCGIMGAAMIMTNEEYIKMIEESE